jgi:hypothetical protein
VEKLQHYYAYFVVALYIYISHYVAKPSGKRWVLYGGMARRDISELDTFFFFHWEVYLDDSG